MIREPAAIKLAKIVLTQEIVRMPLTPAIIASTAKVIMTFVRADEQAQRREKMLGEEPKE